MNRDEPFRLEVVSVRLVKDAPIYSEQPFTSPEHIAAALGGQLCQMDREIICVVNLKADLTPINVHFASVGALNQAIAHPRELLKAAILSNAASILIIHSHPSGNLMPSKYDTMVTDQMCRICELMEIPLVDHIIVGGDNRDFFSFQEKGLVPNPKLQYSMDYRTLDMKPPMAAEKGKAR